MSENIKRSKYSKFEINLSIADEIEIFQNYVRDRARAGDEYTEYPTDWLLAIAEALDHVKTRGRPRKSLNKSIIELLAIRKARWEYRRLRSNGIGQDHALKQIARSPIFKEIFKTMSFKTLKSKILRRKYR
jgi:hypothetical protein